MLNQIASDISWSFFTYTVPASDFMFFLDVYRAEADRKIKQTRRKTEMFETLDELERIRVKALALAYVDNWRILDANKHADAIQKEITNAL